MRFLLLVFGLVVAGFQPVFAQEGGAALERRLNSLMSRYELALDKLQGQNERLQSDVRTLQRTQGDLQKKLDDANKRAQSVADEMQRQQNTASLEEKASRRPWGERQRDCSDIGAKHQQIKVTLSPDGNRGVRYLCFDGKVLHLGSEVYTVGE